MAANAEATPHTPTALERLKIAFIEATAAEQESFVAWAELKIQLRRMNEGTMRPWPDRPPPDV